MKFLLVISILSSIIFEFRKVSQSNELRLKAEQAFKEQKFLLSIRYYNELLVTYKVKDESLIIDMAHAYFKIADLASAARYYKKITNSNQKPIRTLANQQLGVIAAYQGKDKLALSYFKSALKSDYKNDQARFNFELLSRKLKKQGGRASSSGKNNSEQDGQAKVEEGSHDKGKNTSAKSESPFINSYNHREQENTGALRQSAIPAQNGSGQKDLMVNEEGTNSANALQSVKFNEIHITEGRAKQILESMKSQEFLLLRQTPVKSKNKKNQHAKDW